MNEFIPFEGDVQGAETIVKIINFRKRVGRVYYRTKIFKSGPESPFFVTTLEYQPSPHELLVGEYEPPITVERVLEDIRRAKVIADKGNFEPKNQAAVALGRLGGKVGGPARAEALPSERRSEIASQAAQARWNQPAAENVKAEEPVPAATQKKRGRPKGWKPKPKVQAEQLQSASALDMDAVYKKDAPPKESDIDAGLQRWYEKLTGEQSALMAEIDALSIRMSEVEEKIKAINTIRQMVAEVTE